MEIALAPFGSLLAALTEVRDPRRAQGQRYSLRHLLLFSVLAVLAGATSYQAIITFVALQRERLNAVFGACFRRAPAVNTLRPLFLALDRDDLETAFRHHARALSASTGAGGMRGRRDAGQEGCGAGGMRGRRDGGPGGWGAGGTGGGGGGGGEGWGGG